MWSVPIALLPFFFCRSDALQCHPLRMVVWSNSQAIEDYKNLLAGKNEDIRSDSASLIIGESDVGHALRQMGMCGDTLIDHRSTIPKSIIDRKGEELNSFPIYLAVKESEIEYVLKNCPDDKREDLVFLQSGCIEPMLKMYGAHRKEQTRGLLYWKFQDGATMPTDCLVDLGEDRFGEPKFAGETCVTGKWAGALTERLQRHGFTCRMLFFNDWRRNLYERVIFDSAFNLVGALHGYQTIGDVAKYYTKEVDDIMYELGRSLRSTFAITMLAGIEERLFAYAEDIESKTATSMSDQHFHWRNGFFYYHITAPARKLNFPDPCEQHSLYLEYGRDNNLFRIPPFEK